MTPQERRLVQDLFDRLTSLENGTRDPEAERAIADGLSRAPNAVYPLVQTVLLQDEALRRANDRIRELEGGEAPYESPGFLDSMRDAFFGRDDGRRGSVPTVPPSKWGSGRPMGAPPFPVGPAQSQGPGGPTQAIPERGGGSFLGTAAAAAAGVIGGSLLLNSIQSLLGGHHGSALASPADSGAERQSPWGGDDASRSDLAREAGLNDVGGSGRGEGQRSGLFNDDPDAGHDDWNDDDFDIADAGDFGDGGGDA